ncbi:MAG: acyl-ACP--UDP-N-acetylglucosamine O-acyltransferase, partial [Bdellovibrionaceae bacterium]|nr:acyl-ACP--UDP-N-acetylglucosamine O-acyltransferase [Pseudobdellovibrionaceae bacterium]
GYFMAYTHIGHDCIVGNNVIIANDSHLGGHCEIGDNVVISGTCGFTQFTRIGQGAFVAGNSTANKDILPFSRAAGNWATCRATNKVGLLRKGFSREEVANIHKALRILILGSDTIDEGLERISRECVPSDHIRYLVDFVRSSKRGIAISRSRDLDLEEES